MKKLMATIALFGFFLMSAQGAFAWTYDGINSLNPFTGFRSCNKCEKVKKDKCHRVKKTKCNKCAKNRLLPQKRCARAF